ncbi:TetR/AcrR family transcriptional regulator [Microbacterium sp. G2-8]|uniref:TetR/AcrR family transcriptional regulator n=1 Tax=Microbacterium sp. G2-8 TaxID=2842454 RepID=UPI001C89448C|nr:TetR/AcrR family transcriptional regulator [Microbacterium sp. G2-8]
MTATWRSTQKANRRAELLAASATLFATRGFAGVSTNELGEAVGMSGPAVYKHFPSKDAILAELLVTVSERLLQGSAEILAEERGEAQARIRALIAFHTDFAISEPDVIRLQDREIAQLSREASHQVRRLQREYVDRWAAELADAAPELDERARQVRLVGAFGLLNSTQYLRGSKARAAAELRLMAERALLGDVS